MRASSSSASHCKSQVNVFGVRARASSGFAGGVLPPPHEMLTRMATLPTGRIEEIGQRINTLMREAGIEVDQVTAEEFAFPPELEQLQVQAAEAFAKGDWEEFHRLNEASQAMLNKHGIVNVNFIEQRLVDG
jgi:hypothetical protein